MSSSGYFFGRAMRTKGNRSARTTPWLQGKPGTAHPGCPEPPTKPRSGGHSFAQLRTDTPTDAVDRGLGEASGMLEHNPAVDRGDEPRRAVRRQPARVPRSVETTVLRGGDPRPACVEVLPPSDPRGGSALCA